MISAISSPLYGITKAISRFDAAANKITAVAPVSVDERGYGDADNEENPVQTPQQTASGSPFAGVNASFSALAASEEAYLSGVVEMTMAKSELAAGIKVYEAAVEMTDELLASV